MKLPPFGYHAPESLEEALALLAEHGPDAKVLAGGQSLVPLLALRMARPAVLIDLRRVAGLDGVEQSGGWLSIGAMTRECVAETSPLVARHVPLLADAMPLIGHAAIRSRGTIGGTVAHADPSAETPAVALALDAVVVARSGAGGERTVAAADFFEGFLTTALQEDEIVTQVRFPVAGPGTGSDFTEVARRHGDFAIAGVATEVRLAADGRIAEARICCIGVSDTPLRRTRAEAALRDEAPSADAFDGAAHLAAAELTPPSDLHGTGAYRKHLVAVLVRRSLDAAARRAEAAA